MNIKTNIELSEQLQALGYGDGSHGNCDECKSPLYSGEPITEETAQDILAILQYLKKDNNKSHTDK